MKFPLPEHRPGKPVTGEEARALLAAIDSGEALTSDAATETVRRILARRATNANTPSSSATDGPDKHLASDI